MDIWGFFASFGYELHRLPGRNLEKTAPAGNATPAFRGESPERLYSRPAALEISASGVAVRMRFRGRDRLIFPREIFYDQLLLVRATFSLPFSGGYGTGDMILPHRVFPHYGDSGRSSLPGAL